MRDSNDCTFAAVDKLRQNPRASVGQLWKVYTGDDGKLHTEHMLTVIFARPKDWMAGRWIVGIHDWSVGYPARHAISSARGCGQDMFANASAGMIAMGVEFGDHADYKGRPTMQEWLNNLTRNEQEGGRAVYLWSGDFRP